jgi:DNA-binding beta-propeller fold protein YncE
MRGVSKWTLNSTIGAPTMYTCQRCWGLFVDISNTLYCSMRDGHQVIKKSLDSDSNAFTIVVGTGSVGYASNMLNGPQGIFVDINFDLYVADTYNQRIQLFQLGQLITKITLNYPTGIVLDADKYLFIVDHANSRIIRLESNSFRCVAGCGGRGSASNQLIDPWFVRFDSYGNMFVTDRANHRIQKFVLLTNLCRKFRRRKKYFFLLQNILYR